MKDKVTIAPNKQNPVGFGYFLGMIGSSVYFIQRVDGFWLIVLALLKALVWPAFLIYDFLKYFAG